MSKPYDPRDRFYMKAKASGLRARSAFKIEEIAQRMGVVKPGMTVLDLGAAPGGWLQILAKQVGPSGLVIGVDLVEIRSLSLPHVKTMVADVTAPHFPARLAAITPGKVDMVTSDMAPKTTGIRATDEARSLELCRIALDCADRHLKHGGAFITKVFMGGDFKQFEGEVQKRFQSVKIMRPEATRERSFEVYITAKGFKGGKMSDSPSQPTERAKAVLAEIRKGFDDLANRWKGTATQFDDALRENEEAEKAFNALSDAERAWVNAELTRERKASPSSPPAAPSKPKRGR